MNIKRSYNPERNFSKRWTLYATMALTADDFGAHQLSHLVSRALNAKLHLTDKRLTKYILHKQQR